MALVRIIEGELKIVDHEGDNYLGGGDFDALMVERLIVPQLEKRGKFTDLVAQMKSETGRFNRLWYSLLSLAENAKIELSTRSSAEIDLGRISVVDEDGKTIDDYLQITRSEFEGLIKDAIDNTAAMLKKILTRNSLRPEDLKFVLMVGGSSYIPFVRKRIEELLGVSVNTGIDPTNAIAIGAAYFAATKEMNLGTKPAEQPSQPSKLKFKVAYPPASQEREELFAAKVVEGDVTGLFYRITRADGGYDSGLKTLASRINEDLPLQEDAYNLFTLKVYDDLNNFVPTDIEPIEIAQGQYSVAGQMLQHDLSLVVDDRDTGDTKLVCIFVKNSVIPAKTKRTVEVNQTVIHGSGDDVIRLLVVEGPSENHPMANRRQGELLIKSKNLKRDVPRGTEIDLTFELSESCDLAITGYINPSGPSFSGIYGSKDRDVSVEELGEEFRVLGEQLEKERDEASENENYEVAAKIEKLCERNEKLYDAAMLMTLDDTTDDKFKLDTRKREVAQELGQLVAGKQIERLRADYQTAKEEVTDTVNESGNDLERRQLREIVTREQTFLNSTNPKKLEEAIGELRHINVQILRRKPDFLISMFQYLIGSRERFNDPLQAKNLIEAGKTHIATENWDRLDEVIGRLFSLLPDDDEGQAEARRYSQGIW